MATWFLLFAEVLPEVIFCQCNIPPKKHFSRQQLESLLLFPQERGGPGWQRGVAVQRDLLAAPQRPRLRQHWQPALVVVAAQSVNRGGPRHSTVQHGNPGMTDHHWTHESCIQLLAGASTVARRSFGSINEPLQEVRCQMWTDEDWF